MSTRRIIVFIAAVAVAALLVLLELHGSSAHNAEQAKRVSLTVLETSTAPIITDSTNRTLLASSKDGESVYSLDSMTGELFVYDLKKKLLRKAGNSLSKVEAFTVGLTRNFLSRKQMGQSGGFTIITSATVNPDTGHVFLSLNGLSTQGTVYEYDQTGTKLREYALLLDSNNKRNNVTHIKDITVSSDSLNVLTSGGIYSFQFSNT